MRWVNKLSDTDIEKLAKKLGIEYESLIIRKEINCIKVYLNGSYYYSFVIYDFSIRFNFDLVDNYDYHSADKLFYLFMENKFGREYLIDLIRNKTGLSGKFLRKKLR